MTLSTKEYRDRIRHNRQVRNRIAREVREVRTFGNWFDQVKQILREKHAYSEADINRVESIQGSERFAYAELYDRGYTPGDAVLAVVPALNEFLFLQKLSDAGDRARGLLK